MPKPTRDEIIDKQEVRRDLLKEARRLSKRPEIRNFLESACRIERYVEEDGTRSLRYFLNGRNQTLARNTLRGLVDDNILPAFRNGKTSIRWTDLNEKIDALVDLLLSEGIPQDMRAWRPVKPATPPPAQGNQGQGQGASGNPNN